VVQRADCQNLGVGLDSYHIFATSTPLAALVLKLDQLGYRGDYSFEVFNDDYQQLPLPYVAERARNSAVWLAEGVLRRSVPLPGRMRLRDVRGA
jgi:sugar phosphate isomerase/epimerase